MVRIGRTWIARWSVEQLLKIEDVAGRLRLSRSQIYEMIGRGEIPSLVLGRSRRVREADLDQFIRERAEELAPVA